MGALDRFEEVWAADFEYRCPDGFLPEIRCGVFIEQRSGRVMRMWADELSRHRVAPFRTDRGSLFVAHNAAAEYGCFLQLGWPLPACTLDTYFEFRALINGRPSAAKGASLLSALRWFGLPSIDAVEKESMRQLAMREGPSSEYTSDEREALLDYCATDVVALIRLLPELEPHINVDLATIRGFYARSVATMERNGIPLDMALLEKLRDRWVGIRPQLASVAADSGVFDEGGSFSESRFVSYLNRHGIGWPLLPSGSLDLTDDAFKSIEKSYPRQIGPIRAVRRSLANTRLFEGFTVGPDGRNRCGLRPFATKTSRHAPPAAKFIFGGASWVRGLIKPGEGRVCLAKDFDQQEFLIAGALAGDPKMIEAYESGDPYLAFAKLAGAVPQDATKKTHPLERSLYKTVILGTQYGMGYVGLADRIGKPTPYAKELLRQHREVFAGYWRWLDAAVTVAMADLKLETVLGWPLHIVQPSDPKERINFRSIGNFPSQGNGGEILRLAINRLIAAGVTVNAPIHDAVLIECDAKDAEEVNRIASHEMEEASRILLGGHTITTDCTVITGSSRYVDERGARFWNHLMGLIGETQLCVAEE